MKKKMVKLAALVLLTAALIAISISSVPVSAAQVGKITVSEDEIKAKLIDQAFSGERAVDLNELVYDIVSTKVMRDRIKGTEFDLPDDFEAEFRQYFEDKLNDVDAESALYLEEKGLTRDDMVEMLYHIRLDAEIFSCYADMMLPQVIDENPGVTDGKVLLEGVYQYVEEIVAELPEIRFNPDAVKRIEAFAAENNLTIVQ